MTPAKARAQGEQKRLGQFFTGTRLARTLATLAKADSYTSIIDPMAGVGDMLVACAEIGAAPTRIGAIEIDSLAATTCKSRTELLSNSVIVETGSAFDIRSWKHLGDEWELVITNPPYVRYQARANPGFNRVATPSAEAVRKGLIEILEKTNTLTESERAVFLQAAKNYSGLSDLAVPSLILCAAMVARQGRIAIVVPNTWLTRNYATPIIYLLRRFFNIESVVLDSDAVWFYDTALVRTTLVVACRVSDKGSAHDPGGHLIVRVPEAAGNETSIVGQAFPSDQPDVEFARWIAMQSPDAVVQSPLECEWSDESDLVGMLSTTGLSKKWSFDNLADSGENETAQYLLPARVRNYISPTTHTNLTTLAELGWHVGQGLRSGANEFFYLCTREDGYFYSDLLPGEALELPAEVLRLAVRRQSDIPKNGCRVVKQPCSAVLVLDNWLLPEDAKNENTPGIREMCGDLERLVRAAAAKRYKREGGEVALPNLSAVRTNVRASKTPETPNRYWYHLPPLKIRHTPALYLPRVNTVLPHICFNVDARLVIDANFSTLWSTPAGTQVLTPEALLAALSSSWTQAILESFCTIMGGGALKIEATHLKRLPLPKHDKEMAAELHNLGMTLVDGDVSVGTMGRIDRVIESRVISNNGLSHASLKSLADRLLNERRSR